MKKAVRYYKIHDYLIFDPFNTLNIPSLNKLCRGLASYFLSKCIYRTLLLRVSKEKINLFSYFKQKKLFTLKLDYGQIKIMMFFWTLPINKKTQIAS